MQFLFRTELILLTTVLGSFSLAVANGQAPEWTEDQQRFLDGFEGLTLKEKLLRLERYNGSEDEEEIEGPTPGQTKLAEDIIREYEQLEAKTGPANQSPVQSHPSQQTSNDMSTNASNQSVWGPTIGGGCMVAFLLWVIWNRGASSGTAGPSSSTTMDAELFMTDPRARHDFIYSHLSQNAQEKLCQEKQETPQYDPFDRS